MLGAAQSQSGLEWRCPPVWSKAASVHPFLPVPLLSPNKQVPLSPATGNGAVASVVVIGVLSVHSPEFIDCPNSSDRKLESMVAWKEVCRVKASPAHEGRAYLQYEIIDNHGIYQPSAC